MSETTAPTPVATAEPLLVVNGIEVIYNHVILVLKGVSLSVPEGGITLLLRAVSWAAHRDQRQRHQPGPAAPPVAARPAGVAP